MSHIAGVDHIPRMYFSQPRLSAPSIVALFLFIDAVPVTCNPAYVQTNSLARDDLYADARASNIAHNANRMYTSAGDWAKDAKRVSEIPVTITRDIDGEIGLQVFSDAGIQGCLIGSLTARLVKMGLHLHDHVVAIDDADVARAGVSTVLRAFERADQTIKVVVVRVADSTCRDAQPGARYAEARASNAQRPAVKEDSTASTTRSAATSHLTNAMYAPVPRLRADSAPSHRPNSMYQPMQPRTSTMHRPAGLLSKVGVASSAGYAQAQRAGASTNARLTVTEHAQVPVVYKDTALVAVTANISGGSSSSHRAGGVCEWSSADEPNMRANSMYRAVDADDIAQNCAYMSAPDGRECRHKSVPGSTWCERHACPVPACQRSKTSRQPTCMIHEESCA